MIALDTNVLVRLLAADDPVQHGRAAAFVRAHGADEGGNPRLFVPAVAVCELVWVLTSAYGFPRQAIQGAVQGLLESRDLALGDRDGVEASLRAYREGRGDFSDYLLREASRRAGCEAVATFDRDLLREEGFRKA